MAKKISYLGFEKPKKIWSAVFECIGSPECKNIFKLHMISCCSLDKAEYSELLISCSNDTHKNPLVKNIRCHGLKRELQTDAVIRQGVTNTRSSNLIENREKGLNGINIDSQILSIFFKNYIHFTKSNNRIPVKPENRKVLTNMRNEFHHRFKLSSDVFIDAIATKTVFESLANKTDNKIVGYVHSIGLDPYGFLLFSEIQVIQVCCF